MKKSVLLCIFILTLPLTSQAQFYETPEDVPQENIYPEEDYQMELESEELQYRGEEFETMNDSLQEEQYVEEQYLSEEEL